MKPGIRYEYRTLKVTVGRRRARGDSYLAGYLERAVPLYSLTMQQGLFGTSVGFSEISHPAVFIDYTAWCCNSAIITYISWLI